MDQKALICLSNIKEIPDDNKPVFPIFVDGQRERLTSTQESTLLQVEGQLLSAAEWRRAEFRALGEASLPSPRDPVDRQWGPGYIRKYLRRWLAGGDIRECWPIWEREIAVLHQR